MGFLGRAAAGLFEREGWVVYRASLEAEEGVAPVDVRDFASVEALSCGERDPDVVILCASTNRGGVGEYRRVFADGCGHLLRRFPASRLIMCGSCSVYAQQEGELVDEESEAEPVSESARILLEAESLVLRSGGTVARLSNLYGPGRSVLLAGFMAREAVMEEDGRRLLNHIHRDDAAAALLLLAETPSCAGHVYNVTDSLPLSQKKMYRALSALLVRPWPPSGPKKEGGKRAWTNKAVSNERLRALGWRPVYESFLEAVPDVLPTLPAGGEE